MAHKKRTREIDGEQADGKKNEGNIGTRGRKQEEKMESKGNKGKPRRRRVYNEKKRKTRRERGIQGKLRTR